MVTLERSDAAPAPRTLVDIFRGVCARHPEAIALDNGAEVMTYLDFEEAAAEVAAELADHGVGLGDRVGVRIASGTTDLYVAIMGILLAGAAYVPVDADDPEERARLVFGEADVAAVIGNALVIDVFAKGRAPVEVTEPGIGHDAWIIFTSGSTGTPKGVAVTHRNAAAFVDAESRMFVQDSPLGAGDRVMAGLSVAFDASCEEMWLAWAYGAALVPAPRSLVRSGMDLGPWLVANRVTVVSTVPTLVAMWPDDALDAVRLLIVGGEACPPELGARFATPEREVWNTYGPTEATVVACGAQVDGGPVRIGLPLDGWDLAVVDEDGNRVSEGADGELVIGGVGLARYLDAAKDAEKYAPMPTLGWDRAYRSGDLVMFDGEGLVFRGRADDQVKVGGRRIELGELDTRLHDLPGVLGGAAAVRKTGGGAAILVGYIAVDASYDQEAALAILRRDLPAALVPRLAVVDDLPTRTSGKIDRAALPWPLDAGSQGDAGTGSEPLDLDPTQQWVRDQWEDLLGAQVRTVEDDFFDLGGSSLTAALLVTQLRHRYPHIRVANVYEHSTLRALAADLEDSAELDAGGRPTNDRETAPVGRGAQIVQTLALVAVRSLGGLRWLTWIALAAWAVHLTVGMPWGTPLTDALFSRPAAWAALALGWLALLFPPGRMVLTAGIVRALTAGLRPGAYARGGSEHLRVWIAEKVVDELRPLGLGGASANRWYAKLLGARIGRHVDLHSVPTVTGMLTVGDGASVETEVDLAGHWTDGDRFLLGRIDIGREARVGMRSTLLPGASIGPGAEIAPGAAVFGAVPEKEFWSGAPAARVGPARGPWAERAPANRSAWMIGYAALGTLMALFPAVAVVAAFVLVEAIGRLAGWATPLTADTWRGSLGAAAVYMPLGALLAFALLAFLVWACVRLCGIALAPGHYPVQSARALAAWATIRVLDEARDWLFPMYSGAITTTWFRLLGARVGTNVEISTALMIPGITTVNDGAFLADDTLIGGYELGGGWLRIEKVKIGKHAFIGNSGMAAPGRKVPKRALVAVLSAAPRRGTAKRGSSWLGSPPVPLRRQVNQGDNARTYAPPRRLRVARGLVETARLLTVIVQGWLFLAVVAALWAVASSGGWLAAALLGGVVLALGGVVAAGLATVAKALLVGRVKREDHALWTSFVWRNELADTYVEQIAAPWFARATVGSPLLNVWLRSMGARIGKGVWCETYWLPEADLVHLGDGVTVGRGSVLQTHLFHDRVLSMDTVTLEPGATIGPNSVILPAAGLGRYATVGPVSLVMRGESIPERTRWIGNPVGPWRTEPTSVAAAGETQATDIEPEAGDADARLGAAGAAVGTTAVGSTAAQRQR